MTTDEEYCKSELKWISKEGYECEIKLINLRHRCGYVTVPKGHITSELDGIYGDVPVNIHGGLTYGTNNTWGFDCAHFGDSLQIWTLEKVKAEVETLSEQLGKLTWEEIIKYKMIYMPEWFKKRVEQRQRVLEEVKKVFESCYDDYNPVLFNGDKFRAFLNGGKNGF